MNPRPNCYECAHRRNIAGDAHSECANTKAKVSADPYGAANGWFIWPVTFDPVWLISCDGFEPRLGNGK